MKKIIVLIAVVISVVSCKKTAGTAADGGNPNNSNTSDTVAANTMTADINDTPHVFNLDVTSAINNITGGQDMSLTATDTNANEIEFSIEEGGTMSAGTYTDIGNATSDAGFGYEVGHSFIEYANADQASHPFTIVITAISSANVKGTFNGIIYPTQISMPDTTKPGMVITNGKFNVNF